MTTDPQPGAGTRFTYHLMVVSVRGQVTRSVSATAPSVSMHLPRFGVAGRDVYFLDADSDLHVLRNDGAVSAVRRLPGSPQDRVVFSVSPDEKLLAYTVFHVNAPTCPPNMPCYPTLGRIDLRVGPLDGSGDSELLSESTLEYPVGWLGNRLIVATGPAFIQNNGEVNPYFATGYRLVDLANPSHGSSVTAVCTDPTGWLTGPIVAAGSACVRGTTVLRLDWANGTPVTLGDVSGAYHPIAALSPAGTRAAVSTFGDRNQDGALDILSGGRTTSTGHVGLAAGWFDDRWLLYVTNPGEIHPVVAVLDLLNSTSTPVDLGANAASIDPYAPFFTAFASSNN